MKTGPDDILPAENGSRSAKHLKTGPDVVGTAENGSGSAKHDNGTRRPRNYRKGFRERKT
jgi:hypothetical protein